MRNLQSDLQIFGKGDAEKCRDDVELAMHTFTLDELFGVCAEESQVVDAKMRARLNADVCTKKGIEHVFERQVWRAKELLNPHQYMDSAFDDLKIKDTDVITFETFEALIQILRTKDVQTPAATVNEVRFRDQTRTVVSL